MIICKWKKCLLLNKHLQVRITYLLANYGDNSDEREKSDNIDNTDKCDHSDTSDMCIPGGTYH